MNDDEIEPIDASLGAVFADERQRDRAPAGSRERVFDRLAASIGGSGGGGPGGGGGATLTALGQRLRLLSTVAALLAGGVIGGVVVATMRPPRVIYVERVASPAASPSAGATAPSAEPASIAFSASPAAASAPIAVVASSGDRDVALAKERAILDVARTALGRNDGAHALEAVERHAREFPRGQMTEEREAIAVQALVKLGRKDEAAARGARFRRRYPDSVLIPVIDAALPPAAAGEK